MNNLEIIQKLFNGNLSIISTKNKKYLNNIIIQTNDLQIDLAKTNFEIDI